MNSLQESVTNEYHEKFLKVNLLIENLLQKSSMQNQNNLLLAFKQVQQQNFGIVHEESSNDLLKKQIIKYYGTNKENKIKEQMSQQEFVIKSSDINLQNYYSVYGDESLQYFHQFLFFLVNVNGYLSTLEFFQDLIQISETLFDKKKKIDRAKQKDKLQKLLKNELKKINKHLPAAVYIPFVTNSIRNYAVLNIVVEESKVFCTKERAPFALCFEIYRPEEDLEEERKESVAKKQRQQKLLKWNFFRKSQKEENKYQNPTDQRLSIAITWKVTVHFKLFLKDHFNKRSRAGSLISSAKWKQEQQESKVNMKQYNQSFAHFDKIQFSQSRISLPPQPNQAMQRNSDDSPDRYRGSIDQIEVIEEEKSNNKKNIKNGQFQVNKISEESTIYFEPTKDIEQEQSSEMNKSGDNKNEEVNRNSSLNEALLQDEDLKGKSQKVDLTSVQAQIIASQDFIFGMDSQMKVKNICQVTLQFSKNNYEKNLHSKSLKLELQQM